MSDLDPKELDSILALQLTVAWAGEKADDPRRLGWWNTDLTDQLAGGDLFSRLLPRTAAWAGLELAREAALRADRAARSKLAHPDQVWTLFHLGFALDEALADRLSYHKRHGALPSVVFGGVWGVQDSWVRAHFEQFLGSLSKAHFDETPAGRQLKKLPDSPFVVISALAAALLPLGEAYSFPHAPAALGSEGAQHP